MPRGPKYDPLAVALLACTALPASVQEVPLGARTVKVAVFTGAKSYHASKNLPPIYSKSASTKSALAQRPVMGCARV